MYVVMWTYEVIQKDFFFWSSENKQIETRIELEDIRRTYIANANKNLVDHMI